MDIILIFRCLVLFSLVKRTVSIIPIDYFRNPERALLHSMKDYNCAFSRNAVNTTRFDPWFCVKPSDCNDELNFRYVYVITHVCNSRPANEERIHCCFIGNILIKNTIQAFTADQRFWGVLSTQPDAFTDYDDYFVTNQAIDQEMDNLLRNSKVCTVIPDAKDQFNQPTFVPYICRPSPCTIPDAFVQKFNIRSGLESKEHSIFCGGPFTASGVGFCCHPLAAAQVERDGSRLSIGNWRIKEFRRDQKFAPGYRSSYYCEQYAKKVCVGIDDQCFLRTVDRSTALPGEFPHQALIGVQSHSFRFFHCSGSLVSRNFILSSSLCVYHDRTPASIALLGDYEIFEWKEYGSRELLVYLSKSIVEPDFDANRNIYRQSRLALFKLWRPVTILPWLRPACLNWKNTFKSGPSGHAKFPEEVTYSGFGTTEYGGRWNNTLKRFVFAPDLCTNPQKNTLESCLPNIQCNKCNDYCKSTYFSHYTTARRQQRLTIDGNKTFCLIPNYGEHLDPNRPCEFDLGAPASVMDRAHNPYCQWRVFGVVVSPKFDCSIQSPALLRVVGGELLPWLEDVIWAEEMSLADFDNTWPTCNDLAETTFRGMIHLKQ